MRFTFQPRASRTRGWPAKFHLVKQQLRNAILMGRLKPNEPLPSFPKVARQLGVAEPTAKRAIDELPREGWLDSRFQWFRLFLMLKQLFPSRGAVTLAEQ